MKAVIYARYSSHGQSEQSIEGQLRDCYAFAEREGLTVIDEYIDKALTGRTDDRPGFQRMISDAAGKHFAVVIVWKLDRFARNRYDSAMYKAQLRKNGVKVISATERISDDPEGIILEGMLESLAEYYSANLSKHVKRGHRDNALAGKFVGGTIPTGYKVQKRKVGGEVIESKLVIDDDKAHIVKYAFEQYAAGVGKQIIVDDLNNKGYRTKRGTPFTIASFSAMLSNRKYIGEYIYDGIEVLGGCPALIDVKLFDAVQAMLGKKKRAPAASTGRVTYHLLGKAYCGECGSRLVGDAGTSRRGVRHDYYNCGKRKKSRTCCKSGERKGFLEWYIVEQTMLYVLAPDRIKYIAPRVVASYNRSFNKDSVADLEKRIIKLDAEINRAVDASIAAPAKARQKFFDKIELLETQRLDVEIDLSRLRIAAGMELTDLQVGAWLRQFCNGDPLDEDFQKRIIDVFINSVYVYDDRIVMYFNIKDGQQISYIEMIDSTSDPPADGDACAGVQNSSVSVHHYGITRTHIFLQRRFRCNCVAVVQT